jgi:site-specific recombinase XerD
VADTEISREIEAFGHSLQARNRSPKTIRAYLEAGHLLEAFLTAQGRPTEPEKIRRADVEAFITDQLGQWTASTAATRYRCLQQLFKFLVIDEVIPVSPMATMLPPSMPETPVPVLGTDELGRLLKVTEGAGFDQRRDHAIIRLFVDSPIRLGEMAGIRTEDIDLKAEVIYVTGKGNRGRLVPTNPKLATALHRYDRERRRHRQTALPWQWLGPKGRLTDSGIAQMLERRATQAGIDGMHAHRFRHTFSHRWLAAGNAEGDLQRLAGWRSAQMLARYGASAADSRARDAYHRSTLWDEL